MNEYISKDVIKIINDKVDILDDDVLSFIENVTCDLYFDRNDYHHIYTLAIFLMSLFDDSVDDLINALISEGWHKWVKLDDWNTYIGSGGCDIQEMAEFLIDIDGGIPSKDNMKKDIKKVITLDYTKYSNKVDFTCTDKNKIGPHDLSVPIIDGQAYLSSYPENMRDELYVALTSRMFRDKGKNAITLSNPFKAFHFRRSQINIDANAKPLVFMSLRDYVNKLNEEEGENYVKDNDLIISTALPKKILEKYGIKTWKE